MGMGSGIQQIKKIRSFYFDVISRAHTVIYGLLAKRRSILTLHNFSDTNRRVIDPDNPICSHGVLLYLDRIRNGNAIAQLMLLLNWYRFKSLIREHDIQLRAPPTFLLTENPDFRALYRIHGDWPSLFQTTGYSGKSLYPIYRVCCSIILAMDRTETR